MQQSNIDLTSSISMLKQQLSDSICYKLSFGCLCDWIDKETCSAPATCVCVGRLVESSCAARYLSNYFSVNSIW